MHGKSTLEQLERLHPGAISIDTATLARTIRVAQQTISNRGQEFAIPSIKIGRKRYFRLIDVADYMDRALGIAANQTVETPPEPTPSAEPLRRRRGRPPKLGPQVQS